MDKNELKRDQRYAIVLLDKSGKEWATCQLFWGTIDYDPNYGHTAPRFYWVLEMMNADLRFVHEGKDHVLVEAKDYLIELIENENGRLVLRAELPHRNVSAEQQEK